MTQSSVITDEMRAVIGKESKAQTAEVDRTAIRMFARAVGHTDAVYYDVEEARRRGYRDLPCPPGYLGTPVFNPELPPDNPYFSFKSPFTRVLNGGNEVEYFDEDICAGDVLTSTYKIADLSERQGGMGPMLLIRIEHTYRNQKGKVVAILRGTGIQY